MVQTNYVGGTDLPANQLNQDFSHCVNVAGDTMFGPLTLSGNPQSGLHAATKQYVDSIAISGGSGGSSAGISVKAFAGPGTSDWTSAFTSAMAAAAAAGTYCYVPPGTYGISAALSWPTGLLGLIGDDAKLCIIQRLAGGLSTNQMLTISNKQGFIVQGVTLDGNKANNSTASQGIVLTNGCTDFIIRRVRCINHKAVSGFGGGIVLASCPATNPNGYPLLVDDCVATGNDGGGLSIATSGASITIRGGNYSFNPGYGIQVNGSLAATLNQIPDLSILDVRAEYNGSTGIGILGFIVTGLGGVNTYGHGNDPCQGTIIAGCQANYNQSYGIFAQVTGGSITNNTCRGNGGAGPATQAGICCNAEATVVSGNYCDSNTAFGIDAGGSLNSEIVDNIVRSASSTDINLGACINVRCMRNTIVLGSEATAIHLSRNDSGQFWFPWDASNVVISQNTIVNNGLVTQHGIVCVGNPEDVEITGNRFTWPDNLAANAILPQVSRGKVEGNALIGATLNGYLANAQVNQPVPDWADVLYINTSTPTIGALVGYNANQAAGQVSGVKLTNRGSGYTSAPTVTPTGTWTVAPTFTAQLTQDGRIAAITFTGGSGVAGGLTVAITGGGGSGGAATVDVNYLPLTGRKVTLVAFGVSISMQAAVLMPLAAPLASVLTLPARSTVTLMQGSGAANSWNLYSQESTDGSIWPTQLNMPSGLLWLTGTGSPAGAVTAPVGSLFTRTDGGAATTLYVKESGTGTSGWVAK